MLLICDESTTIITTTYDNINNDSNNNISLNTNGHHRASISFLKKLSSACD